MNYALAYECHKKTTVQMNKSYDLYKEKDAINKFRLSVKLVTSKALNTIDEGCLYRISHK